jgi:hypothetical protein
MPTHMHTYARIAKRFGIDEKDLQAIDEFFIVKVPQMATSVQEAILHELLAFDGMSEEEVTKESLSKAFEHLFNEDGNLKGTPLKAKKTDPNQPKATTININFKEQELEAKIEEQRKEIFRLTEHNRIARSELTRIKDGIKRCQGTMIVDGNDMYDWGWMPTAEVNPTNKSFDPPV